MIQKTDAENLGGWRPLVKDAKKHIWCVIIVPGGKEEEIIMLILFYVSLE